MVIEIIILNNLILANGDFKFRLLNQELINENFRIDRAGHVFFLDYISNQDVESLDLIIQKLSELEYPSIYISYRNNSLKSTWDKWQAERPSLQWEGNVLKAK